MLATDIGLTTAVALGAAIVAPVWITLNTDLAAAFGLPRWCGSFGAFFPYISYSIIAFGRNSYGGPNPTDWKGVVSSVALAASFVLLTVAVVAGGIAGLFYTGASLLEHVPR